MRDSEKIAFIELVVAFLEGLADEAQVASLNDQLAADADKRELFVDLSMQPGLLKEVIEIERVEKSQPRKVERIGLPTIAWATLLVAACLAAIIFLWPSNKPKPSDPIGNTNPVTLASGWKIVPTGAAKFEVINDGRVRLIGGELLVHSTPKQPSQLIIETPTGDAHAKGTRFYIGTHQFTGPPAGSTQTDGTQTDGTQSPGTEEKAMLKSLTRVLILSGVVTLTTALGSVEGAEGDVLSVEPGKVPTKLAVQANSDFAWDLYQRLAQENKGKNLFFSPYSISSALAMTAEGARGQTAAEMGTVLRFPKATRRIGRDAQRIPWEAAKIHVGMNLINQRLNRENKPYDLHVANALWGERTFPFRPQFVKSLDGFYGAAFHSADFIGNPDAERQRINQWVEDRTENRIKDLLPKDSLESTTRMVLTNAIYFKGNWSQPFNEKLTRQSEFTKADGGKTKVSMMHHDPMGVTHDRDEEVVWPFGYAAFDAAGKPASGLSLTRQPSLQILEMPYAGKELSMFILLPSKRDGLVKLEKQLSQQKIGQWLAAVKKQEVAVWMPKFKLETEFSLKPTLKAMGMPSAFLPGGFTGISDSPTASQLFISAVRHKAFVELNEHGTEATAATVVLGGFGAGPRYTAFFANHSFIFLIRDNETGSILFAGRMMNPTD
jgi:serpin B